jgi:hypothetical protein
MFSISDISNTAANNNNNNFTPKIYWHFRPNFESNSVNICRNTKNVLSKFVERNNTHFIIYYYLRKLCYFEDSQIEVSELLITVLMVFVRSPTCRSHYSCRVLQCLTFKNRASYI